jgi:hypothetical protein
MHCACQLGQPQVRERERERETLDVASDEARSSDALRVSAGPAARVGL